MSAKIAVLVRRFPKLSETFILGEISNLADMSLNMRIVGLHRPNAKVHQPGASRLQDKVSYIDKVTRAAAFITLMLALFRKPALLADLAGNIDHD